MKKAAILLGLMALALPYMVVGGNSTDKDSLTFPVTQKQETRKPHITENHWQVALNNKVYRGKLEVKTPSGRCDIVTDSYAVEVDKVSKYQEGVAQSLRYGKELHRKPVLAVYIDGQEDGLKLLEEAKEACIENGIQLVLINSLVSVDDIINLTTQNPKDTYWLSKSGVRHNKSCRYYHNTKGGKPCMKDEGRPCSICGG